MRTECRAWRDLAACKGSATGLFFPTDDDDAGLAKIICAGCVVRQCCLDSALLKREPAGVWGGLTPNERKRLRRRQRSTAVPA